MSFYGPPPSQDDVLREKEGGVWWWLYVEMVRRRGSTEEEFNVLSLALQAKYAEAQSLDLLLDQAKDDLEREVWTRMIAAHQYVSEWGKGEDMS